MKKVLILNAIVMVMAPLAVVGAEEVIPATVPAPVIRQIAPIQPMDPAQFIEPRQPEQPPQFQQSPQPQRSIQPTQQQSIPFQNGQSMPQQNAQNDTRWVPEPFRGEQGGTGKMPNQNVPQGGQDQGLKFRTEIMKKWAAQMEKSIAQYAKKISAFETKKIPVSVDAKEALLSLRALIEKAKNLSENEEVDMGDTNDMMQTLDEGVRNAEVASQFPKVMKEAVREIARQNLLVKKAVAKAPKLKIDVASLVESWKQDIADMTTMKDDAQKAYDVGEVVDAVQALRGDFFDLSRDANEKGRTFDMVSNIQQMIKSADKDIKTFTNQVAKLKKKGKDVSELENIINQGKVKIAELKTVIASGDADQMIEAAEELNSLKIDFEEAYYGITGQSAYGAFGQMPSMPSLQGGMSPQQNPQFFNPSGGNSMPQTGGQTCKINGVEMPGSCKDIEKKMNSQEQGASIYKTLQGIMDWFKK